MGGPRARGIGGGIGSFLWSVVFGKKAEDDDVPTPAEDDDADR